MVQNIVNIIQYIKLTERPRLTYSLYARENKTNQKQMHQNLLKISDGEPNVVAAAAAK